MQWQNLQTKVRKDLLVVSNLNKTKVMRLRRKQKTVVRKSEDVCQESGILPNVSVGMLRFITF